MKGNSMKAIIKSLVLSLLIMTVGFAGGFDIGSKGKQTFFFKDKAGRNQATFFSTTPLEDITGMSSDVWGTVSFNIEDLDYQIESVSGEIDRFRTACNKTANLLIKTKELSTAIYDDQFLEIFESQVAILNDNIFLDEIEALINEKK